MRKISVIPDRIFHKLWDNASNMTKDDFVATFAFESSDKQINFKKYGIKEEDVGIVLSDIHTAANMSLKTIMEKAKIKKSQFSHAFCIPIRTVEEWYAGNNKMPSYIKLFVMRYYGLINICGYVETEASLKMRVYATTLIPKKKRRKKIGFDEIISDQTLLFDDKYYSLAKGDIKDLEESIKVRELLNKTDYLDKIIEKRKKNS